MLMEVNNLHVGYGKKEIVHGVSFGADEGEFVCVIGANGCGKTTMLKSVLGLLKPFGGSVTVGGVDTMSMHEKERAKRFAYIPQAHTPPFPFSVADVIILGRTPYINTLAVVSERDKMIAFEAIELLGIEDIADQNYTELSGGQQQLVLIARALAQQPSVLVMDEPTASLDYGNQQMVLRQMKKLTRGGTTVIMVTHDPNHAFVCATRVLAMQAGNLIADGAPEEIMTSELLRKIYDTELSVLDVEPRPGVRSKVCCAL